MWASDELTGFETMVMSRGPDRIDTEIMSIYQGRAIFHERRRLLSSQLRSHHCRNYSPVHLTSGGLTP